MKVQGFIACITALLMSQTAGAELQRIIWDYLVDTSPTSPFVERSAGSDGFWGTADDRDIPGRNLEGYANFGRTAAEDEAHYGGTLVTHLDIVTGNSTIESRTTMGTFNCYSCIPRITNLPIASMLDSGGTNFLESTGVSSYTWTHDFLDPFSENIWRSSGIGTLFTPSIPPSGRTSDANVIEHFNTINPSLPSGWQFASIVEKTSQVIAGPDAGFTIFDTDTLFTTSITEIIEGVGGSQLNPVLPGEGSQVGTFLFENAQSGAWFDPIPTETFDFEMQDGSLFTHIISLPEGFDDEFSVSVEGEDLGEFGPGEVVSFISLLGEGVSSFSVSGINPLVDGEDPNAFPIQLAFDNPTASFTMTPAPVPLPAPFILLGSALAALGVVNRKAK